MGSDGLLVAHELKGSTGGSWRDGTPCSHEGEADPTTERTPALLPGRHAEGTLQTERSIG